MLAASRRAFCCAGVWRLLRFTRADKIGIGIFLSASSPVQTGEGDHPSELSERWMVEGALASMILLHRKRSFDCDAPSTTLRVVPLPRYRGGGCTPSFSRCAFASELGCTLQEKILPNKKGGEAPKGAMSWSRATLANVAIRWRFRRGSARIAARTPSGAPPRARFGESTPRLSSSRASWETSRLRETISLKQKTWRHRVSPASSPVPVQRAPRRPVDVPAGRCPEPPGSGCKSARGHRTRSVFRHTSGRRPLR
jgi:hypothetical protein